MIEYKYNEKENKFIEDGHTMFEFDVLQRLKRLAYLEEQIIQKQLVPIQHIIPNLFYVVAPSQYEEGNLEQITIGLTYERAVAYRDGDFCKKQWPNAYILASLNTT